MPATKILWGQIITVLSIVLTCIWGATEWVAWRLAFQPELGAPWFRLFGFPIYLPPSFFWWWYGYDAYAPQIFVEGAYIAASGGFIAAHANPFHSLTIGHRLAQPNLERLPDESEARHGDDDAAGIQFPGDPIGGQAFAAAARHDEFSALRLFDDVVMVTVLHRAFLVRARLRGF